MTSVFTDLKVLVISRSHCIKLCFMEIGCESVNCIQLAQVKVMWQAFMNMVL
jgi:hypothetical protein